MKWNERMNEPTTTAAAIAATAVVLCCVECELNRLGWFSSSLNFGHDSSCTIDVPTSYDVHNK